MKSFVASMFVAASTAAQTNTNTNWSYRYNGADWGNTCKTGQRQSPINIISATSTDRYGNYQLRGNGFENHPAKIVHKGTASMHLMADDGMIYSSNAKGAFKPQEKNEDEKKADLYENYKPFEYQFKFPSEHRINGQDFDVEMQIAMRKIGSTTGAPDAIISIVFDQGKAYYHNKFIESILGNADQAIRPMGTSTAVDVNFQDFLDGVDVSTYFEYDGSITVPPCTEGVKRFVIPHIQSLSKRQKNHILNYFQKGAFATGGVWQNGEKGLAGDQPGNNRMIQKTNQRKVFQSYNKDIIDPNGAQFLKLGLATAVAISVMAF